MNCKTANEFMDWYSGAAGGESFMYAEARNFWEAMHVSSEGRALAGLIHRLAQEGKILLTQRVLGKPLQFPETRHFQYLATKRSKIGPPAWNFERLPIVQAA